MPPNAQKVPTRNTPLPAHSEDKHLRDVIPTEVWNRKGNNTKYIHEKMAKLIKME